jgi:hypothetical protein
MERRDLLALAGLTGLTGLSGCLGYDVVESEQTTRQKVKIAELEAKLDRRDEQIVSMDDRIADLEAEIRRLRRQQRGPRINRVSLVDGWERLGDVVHESIDEIPAGEDADIAVNYTYPVHRRSDGGREEVGEVVELTNLDGETVARTDRRVELFLDPDQTLAESKLTLDTSSLPPGQYSAVAAITDLVTGTAAEPEGTVVTVS